MTAIATRTSLTLALAWMAWACTAEGYSRAAERQASRILEERDEAILGTRESRALRPEESTAPPVEPANEAAPAEETRPPARVIDLREALATAYRSSRRMIDRREELHLDALSLAGTRHAYTPQLDLALSYLFSDVPDERSAGGVAFQASQILPTGGRLQLDAASDASSAEANSRGDDPRYSSFASISLAQPLLRGGGYAVTHEPLVQAERSLVYSIREFELFREDFTIDVARRFYDLVNRKQSIENQRRNLENNEFGRRQAEALFAVGRANELDVLRARRSELNARNSMLESQESFQLALDDFRIFLGLPESDPLDVEPDSPAFTPVHYTLGSAVEVAFHNRLDLLNRREQLEDAERRVRLSRNALLPDLNLTLSATYATDPTDTLGGGTFDDTDRSLALTLGLPVDRVRERNAYRSDQIALERARRNLEEFEDQLRVSIQSSFRELERRFQSLEIQRQLIEDQTKNLRIAELRFERGELPNRDVVEANQSLLDAKNALIDEQVSYEIARLQLLRDLGILFIDETGMWK